MRKFGYLDKGTSKTEALYHEDAVVNAIKNMQRYGALNETGILDNETLKVCLHYNIFFIPAVIIGLRWADKFRRFCAPNVFTLQLKESLLCVLYYFNFLAIDRSKVWCFGCSNKT